MVKEVAALRDRNVLVLGLAKSGFAAAKALLRVGARVTVNDAASLENDEHATILKKQGAVIVDGGHPEEIVEGPFDLIVKNPGIPYSNPVLKRAQQKGVPIWTEVELAYLISEAPMIGITGSNGKTTTTTLLYHLLNIDHKQPLLAGNIGTVATDVAMKATEQNVLVTELSSFQLMGVETFRPKVAILLNVYDAHLDYHGTKEAYIEAKANVTRYQTEDDYIIYNAEQEEVVEAVAFSKAKKVPFTRLGRTEEGISSDDDYIYWYGEKVMDRSRIQLPGDHNLQNILAATAAALLLDCSEETLDDVLSSFTGVKHRMQFVKECNRVKYYSDSKATNTLATKSALLSFDDSLILIAGGLERNHTFEPLRPYMDRVKAVVAIGETKERFATFAKSCNVEHVVVADSMMEAVERAEQLSEAGDVILLSPACASWDQYASFELRGDTFIEAVASVTK